jgi:ribonuclease J
MNKIKIVPLGGMGQVTQNMFLFQYDQEILIADCGIGFPDLYMPGADIIIPDISYLLSELKQGKKIVGLVFSHGHDDHIAALPYLLPELPDFPIYGSSLTAGFAQNRIKDAGLNKKVNVMQDHQQIKLGQHFAITSHAVTHSVPDSKHLLIDTPEGVIYYGSDFKIDRNPIDGVLTDLDAVKQAGNKGILLMLLDCLRVEREEWSKSESTTGPAIEREIQGVKGKFIVTLMSSHLHRIQQVIDISVKNKRKVCFIGRSVEQSVKAAQQLGKLKIPLRVLVNKKNLSNHKDHELTVVIAGSQGQEGSSLVRAVFGEHSMVRINDRDKVVFSADAIPGNEVPYYRAIDELCKNRIQVVYPTLSPNIHQTGHASAAEQLEMLSLAKPKFVMPIGGADRHRELFRTRVAHKLGYTDEQILVPQTGDIVALSDKNWKIEQQIKLNPKIIDGLGIGDVGPVVLSDRLALSEAGMVVVVIPRANNRFQLGRIEVISRGFVFMKQADEVIKFIKEITAGAIRENPQLKDHDLRRKIEKELKKKLYKTIQREPIVIPVFLD